MIRIGVDNLLVLAEDGTISTFDADGWEVALNGALSVCGVKEKWIASQIILQLEDFIRQNNSCDCHPAIEDIRQMLTQILEDVGYSDAVENFLNPVPKAAEEIAPAELFWGRDEAATTQYIGVNDWQKILPMADFTDNSAVKFILYPVSDLFPVVRVGIDMMALAKNNLPETMTVMGQAAKLLDAMADQVEKRWPAARDAVQMRFIAVNCEQWARALKVKRQAGLKELANILGGMDERIAVIGG